MIPSVGQGALAVEVRADDGDVNAIVSVIDHADTRACVTAERAFLERLGAGCKLPVGAYARVQGNEVRVMATVGAIAGSARLETQGPARAAGALGRDLGDRALAASGTA
jgi:hydroxymethylbilane synthase